MSTPQIQYNLPIYAEGREIYKTLTIQAHNPNAGLWFERFFNHYHTDWSIPSKATIGHGQDQQEVNPRAYWLKKNFTRTVGDKKHIEAFNKKQLQLVHALDGAYKTFTLEAPFVTGMGNSHPVDNGFTWHTTLGVPYLPASSVKGILRTVFETHLEGENFTDEDKRALLFALFGSTTKNTQSEHFASQAGGLICFDALPTQQVNMGLNIMTPHAGKWYEQGKDIQSIKESPSAVPADWHDPIPVIYLVAKTPSTFLFSLAVRPSPNPLNQELLNYAMSMLEFTLSHYGAGAKTSLGHGHMKATEDRDLQEIWTELDTQRKMSDLQNSDGSDLWIEFIQARETESWESSSDNFIKDGIIENWLTKLEAEFDPQVFEALKALTQKYLPKVFKPPKKTKPRQENLRKQFEALTKNLP